MKGAGVQAVIARSFAFIYSRNQPSLGLLGIVMDNEAFFEAAVEGEDISIHVEDRSIMVGGKVFQFRLSNMEYKLTVNNGIAKTYSRFGKSIWQKLMQDDTSSDDKVEKAVAEDQAGHRRAADRIGGAEVPPERVTQEGQVLAVPRMV